MNNGNNLKQSLGLWAAWTSSFWIVRGGLAAMSLAGLLPSIIDMTRFEILRMFHVFVFAWREVLTSIGKLLQILPWLPELSFAFISTLLILFNIIMPIALGYARTYYYDYQHPDNGSAFLLGVSPLLRLIINLSFLGVWTLSLLAFFFSLMSGSAVCVQRFCLDSNSGTFIAAYLLPALAILSFFYALAWLPKMRSGAMAVIGFLIFSEVAYFLASPALSSSINNYVCEAGNIPEREC